MKRNIIFSVALKLPSVLPRFLRGVTPLRHAVCLSNYLCMSPRILGREDLLDLTGRGGGKIKSLFSPKKAPGLCSHHRKTILPERRHERGEKQTREDIFYDGVIV